MREYVLPFDYNKSTQLAMKIAGTTGEHDEEMNTPEKYKALLSCRDFGPEMYITKLQKTGWRNHGGIGGVDKWGAVLENAYKGRTAFLVCPGPSIKDTLPDPKLVAGKLVMAANSAWFYARTKYWIMAEALYVKWLWLEAHSKLNACEDLLLNQDIIMTPRATAWWWRKEAAYRGGNKARGKSYGRIYVTRLEEVGSVPFPVDGTTTYNALGTAWYMGCTDVVVFGLDLCKVETPYVSGVPYSQKGAELSYDPQIECLKFAKWPGLTIHNVNPYSNAFGLPFHPMDVETAWKLLKAAPVLKKGEPCDM